MPRTICWRLCVRDACVADGTPQSCMWSVTIGIYAYASSPPWYHGLYPGIKVFGVRYLEVDSISYKALASQVLRKGFKQVEISVHQTVNWTWKW
jgi:hypothetical protein